MTHYTNTAWAGASTTYLINASHSANTTVVTNSTGGWDTVHVGGKILTERDGLLQITPGDYELADGSLLRVDDRGNFAIEDTKAQVVYQANRVREFNPYVNAADLLASFIRDVGAMGVSAREVADLPVSLLVNWLVLEAAKADGDPVPAGVPLLPADPVLRRYKHPRCRKCQRFVSKLQAASGLLVCGVQCFTHLLPKVAS